MSDEQNLTIRSVKAVSWVLIFHFMNQFVQIVFGIIMVRLLTPADYGILGILAIFWSVCHEFIQGGFGQALLQRKEVTDLDLSSVFYYNIFLSLICCVAMIAAAPFIARYFDLPILKPITQVTAWTLPIGALGSTQNIILSRSLKQGLANLSKFLSLLISIPLAIWMAYRGWGVWALVWQSFIATFFGTVFIFLFVRWVPLLKFSLSSLARLFKFGSRIFINGLLYSVVTNVYNLIIGKIYGIQTLGYYEQARRYSSLWPIGVQGAIGTVLFPAFSKVQDDLPRLKNAFRRTLAVSAFIVIFPTLLLCTLSHPIIELILTPKWLPAIPIWWFLTVCYTFYPVEELNAQLIKAVGDSKTFLRLKLSFYILTFLNIICTARYGITWLLFGMVLVRVLYCLLTAYCAGFKIGYSAIQQSILYLFYWSIAAVSCTLAWLTNWKLCTWDPWGGFIGAVLVGIASFIALNYIFRTQALVELKNIARALGAK
jgi:O-antigen/teichoic acid export membrane protein